MRMEMVNLECGHLDPAEAELVSITEAANFLGIGKSSFYSKWGKWGLNPHVLPFMTAKRFDMRELRVLKRLSKRDTQAEVKDKVQAVLKRIKEDKKKKVESAHKRAKKRVLRDLNKDK